MLCTYVSTDSRVCWKSEEGSKDQLLHASPALMLFSKHVTLSKHDNLKKAATVNECTAWPTMFVLKKTIGLLNQLSYSKLSELKNNHWYFGNTCIHSILGELHRTQVTWKNTSTILSKIWLHIGNYLSLVKKCKKRIVATIFCTRRKKKKKSRI